MSLLSRFMKDLLDRHEGVVEIVQDNPRTMTTAKRQEMTMKTNLYACRWFDNNSQTKQLLINSLTLSPPTRHLSDDGISLSDNNDKENVVTRKKRRAKKPKLPILASKNDIPSYSIHRSIHQESKSELVAKTPKKGMSITNALLDYRGGPTSPTTTTRHHRSSSSQNKANDSLESIPLKMHLHRRNVSRSLSKTLGVAEVKDVQAPKLPTRKPSAQGSSTLKIPQRANFSHKTTRSSRMGFVTGSSRASVTPNPDKKKESSRRINRSSKKKRSPLGKWFSPLIKKYY